MANYIYSKKHCERMIIQNKNWQNRKVVYNQEL